jgi:UDP-2-acetamido-3-amino-2,3-dideoxy-glucuronate N-acetyltransferase
MQSTGLTMKYFCHERAIVESQNIGENTRISANTRVLSGARIGRDCDISDFVFVENDVVIGDRVTIKSGVQLWDGLRLEDDVFVGPNATFSNDVFPRSKQQPERLATTVQTGASIGANATILCGVVIGRHAMVGAGAVVTKRVPPNAIVVGNPAIITGYVPTTPVQRQGTTRMLTENSGPVPPSGIPGVQRLHLPLIPDMRGSLSFAEIGQHLPFVPKRYFLVFDVRSREVRGEHAHKALHQFLVCVNGSCSVMVDDGRCREEYVLDSPRTALHIPPMVWGVEYKYSSDAVLLVLASDVYDPDDYIRDYDEFMSMVALKKDPRE